MGELDNKLKEIARLLNVEEDNLNSGDLFSQIFDKIQRIKRENDMLNLALDSCVDHFHITDGKGTILRVNTAFEKNCKIKREFVEGRTTSEMEQLGVYKPSMTGTAIKEKRQITFVQSVPMGEVITTCTPVLDEEGNVKLVVSNARFINELKLLHKYFKERSAIGNGPDGNSKEFVSQDPLMISLKDMAKKVAPTDSSILILGETGSGKSMLAKLIHENSARSKGNFIEINCAAIPENLIESELFGYSAGAFTGAKKEGKRGLIELANNGTLFLDEIGDMPLNVQAKLFNFLQSRTITRVGGEDSIPVDIRLITATNKDLEKMTHEGLFRSELYYRINVVPITIPPLRNRQDDIPLLIEYFRNKFCNKYSTIIMISHEVIECMLNYSWPGNVRELENLIERLIVLDRNGIIELEDMPATILASSDTNDEKIMVNRIVPLKEAIEEFERKLVISVYNKYKSSYKVAEKLNISQSAAMRKIHKYVNPSLEED